MDASADHSRLLTFEELAARTPLSKSTLRRLIKNGRIPFIQPSGKGGRVLFPVDAIERGASVALIDDANKKTPVSDRLSGPRPAWQQRRDTKA